MNSNDRNIDMHGRSPRLTASGAKQPIGWEDYSAGHAIHVRYCCSNSTSALAARAAPLVTQQDTRAQPDYGCPTPRRWHCQGECASASNFDPNGAQQYPPTADFNSGVEKHRAAPMRSTLEADRGQIACLFIPELPSFVSNDYCSFKIHRRRRHRRSRRRTGQPSCPTPSWKNCSARATGSLSADTFRPTPRPQHDVSDADAIDAIRERDPPVRRCHEDGAPMGVATASRSRCAAVARHSTAVIMTGGAR